MTTVGSPAHVLEISLLGCRTRVRSDEPTFIEWLDQCFQPPGQPEGDSREPVVESEYIVTHRLTEQDEVLYTIRGPYGRPLKSKRWSSIQLYLERAFLIEMARGAPDHLNLVHSGAIVHRDQGIVFPARSGSGKSTLMAALAISGFEYFSDEIAVLSGGGWLYPFTKAIRLKEGGRIAIEQTYAGAHELLIAPAADRRFLHLIAPVPPSPEHASKGCRVGFVILPQYVAGGHSKLTPIPKTVALERLMRQSMNQAFAGREGFDILLKTVNQAECYRLEIDDLHEAVDLVRELADR